MDSPGTKQQIIGGGTMATTEISYLRNELEIRRRRLLDASTTPVADTSLRQLLASVDAALSRLDAGTFGTLMSVEPASRRRRARSSSV